MALIETEEAAGRLARVIVSDIEIYNRQKIATGGDLSRELQEGFSLFQSRVVPALLPLFESVLSNRGLLAGKLPPAMAGAAARYADLRSEAARVKEAEMDASDDPTPVGAAEPEPEPAYAAEPVAAPAAVDPAAPVEQIAPADTVAMQASSHAPPAEEAVAQETLAQEPPVEDPRAQELTPPLEEVAAAEDAATVAARRLARVIVSDIVIYNPKKVAARADLGREINEGRALFKSRVAAEHLHIFEALLVERGLMRAEPAGTGPQRRMPTPARYLPAAPAELPTPVVEVAPVLRRPTPVREVPPASDAPTPVVEALPAVEALRMVEPLPPVLDAPPETAPAESFSPFETPPAASETVGPPPANDWDAAPARPRRPLPPPIPVEARVQAVRAAALELPRPEPRPTVDGDAIMTSALELPIVSAPAAAPAPSLQELMPLSAMAMTPRPAPVPLAPAPAALIDAPIPDSVLAPLRPAAAANVQGKSSKARLVMAGAAILTAAATTYYLLSFWPSR